MKTLTSTLLFCLMLFPLLARADMQKFGDVDINYSVVTADTLSPQVAKAYGISHSKNRLLLTVVATRTKKQSVPQPIRAEVSAYTVNLAGQLRQIRMRMINEGRAVYFIGDFGYSSPETLKFTLNVTELGAATPYKVEFQREF